MKIRVVFEKKYDTVGQKVPTFFKQSEIFNHFHLSFNFSTWAHIGLRDELRPAGGALDQRIELNFFNEKKNQRVSRTFHFEFSYLALY